MAGKLDSTHIPFSASFFSPTANMWLKFQEAIASARDAVKDKPEYLPAYLLLGSLYEKSGDVKNAELTYENALSRDANYGPIINNLAWIYCEHGGNLDVALGLAQKAKQDLPNDPNVADTLAWIGYRKGLYSSSLKSFQELVRASPQVALYQFHLGMCLLRIGNLPEGRAVLTRALALNLTQEDAKEARMALSQASAQGD